MPYLGNNHIVGDSVNNFKVLDDISTFTATFDGSSASVVSTANETIKVLKHRFVQGQRVTYNNGGGSNIGGLTSGTAYYVIEDTAHTIKLAANSSDARISAGGPTSCRPLTPHCRAAAACKQRASSKQHPNTQQQTSSN